MTGELPAMRPQQVSVALCTHNGERFLAEQLASILKQTRPPTEIVLSDDASTDRTVRIAQDAVANRNSHGDTSPVDLVLLRNPVALGVTKNFERALSACKSDLVAVCDQDDVWMPDRLELAIDAFEHRSSLLMLHGDADLIDSDGVDLGTTLFTALEVTRNMKEAIHAGLGFEVLMRRNVVTGATSMIRRELIQRAMPFPDSWLHDEWLAIIASAYGGLDLIEQRLIGYRQHGANEIGVRRLRLVEKVHRLGEPGAERNRRLLTRSSSLAERLSIDGNGVVASRVEAAKRKHEHELERSRLSTYRLVRIPSVLRGLSQGRYRQFGRGAADAVRDLLQPLSEPR